MPSCADALRQAVCGLVSPHPTVVPRGNHRVGPPAARGHSERLSDRIGRRRVGANDSVVVPLFADGLKLDFPILDVNADGRGSRALSRAC
jgi:hypothetical protein